MNITTEKAAEAKPIIGVDIAKNCFQLGVPSFLLPKVTVGTLSISRGFLSHPV
jgi:hypothetical protein